jgi:CRISPR-associated endoribonuclease Cas6
MDLLSLVLTLRPLQLPANRPETPRWWGRAAHGLVLSLVNACDATLAAQLHDESNARPFTASTLMGHFERGALLAPESYLLRLTAMRADLAQLLSQEAASGALRCGAAIELDYIPFQIVAFQPVPQEQGSGSEGQMSDWAASTTYQELSAPYLLSKREPPRRLSLLLASPTAFKSGGKHVPFPSPGLVFGSLLERWNTFAPIAFPDEARRFAEECLALSQFRLETRPAPVKGGGMRVGAIGKVAFTSLNYDRYWLSVLTTLADFSLFAGVGGGTSMGLGQCRRIEDFKV